MSFIVGRKYAKLNIEYISHHKVKKVVTIKIPMTLVIDAASNKNSNYPIYELVASYIDNNRIKYEMEEGEWYTVYEYAVNSVLRLIIDTKLIIGE